MAFLIKARDRSRELELTAVRNTVLSGISGLRSGGKSYSVEPVEPAMILQHDYADLYVLGNVLYSNGFDRVLAVDIRCPEITFTPEYFDALKQVGFIPDVSVMLGIESANGFDAGILHKNLSRDQISEAVGIGQRLRREVSNVADVLFQHSLVDNREVVRVFESCQDIF